MLLYNKSIKQKGGVMAKKLFIIFILVMVVLFPYIAHAAPVGNIAKHLMLKHGIFSEGRDEVSLEPLFKRDMKIRLISDTEYDLTFDRNIVDQIGDTELTFVTEKIGLAFADRVFLYGLVGVAWYEQEYMSQGARVEIETGKDLAWGVGGSVLLYEMEIDNFDCVLRLGADAKLRSTDADINEVIVDGTKYKSSDSAVSSVDYEYKDWQVAGEVSLQWKHFVPYFGVKYSDVTGNSKQTVAGTVYEDKDIEAEDNFGVFTGIDMVVSDFISFNVEGRFIDENAISLGCAIRF